MCGAHGSGQVLPPTETSRISVQLFGRSLSISKTFSQVSTTLLVNPFFDLSCCSCFSSVSLWVYCAAPSESHFFTAVCFSRIALSQHNTHVKRADSEGRLEVVGMGNIYGLLNHNHNFTRRQQFKVTFGESLTKSDHFLSRRFLRGRGHSCDLKWVVRSNQSVK